MPKQIATLDATMMRVLRASNTPIASNATTTLVATTAPKLRFPEICDSRESPEIPGNFRKFPEILGNPPTFPKFPKFPKFLKIILAPSFLLPDLYTFRRRNIYS